MQRLPFLILLSSFSLAGCALPSSCPPPYVLVEKSAQGNSVEQAGLEEKADQRPLRFPILQAGGIPTRNILVLSGGGKYGAYSAGVLYGWSESGKRPVFDVVTGISTGALIAPLAFVGQKYDTALMRNYTQVSTRDIYRRRSLVSLPWAESLAVSSPLENLIARDVTLGMLGEVAAAHAKGRRLYVGTTNLNTKQLTVWDMGAIASSSDPDKLSLFRKIILASASVPGLLPPVPIPIEVDGQRYAELHVDGGVGASLFVPPGELLDSEEAANVYVIVAGKLYPEPMCVERSLFTVSSEAIHGLLDSSSRGDLLLIYLLSKLSQNRFHLTAVPQELPVSSDSTRFDPPEMQVLYETGRQFAASQVAWRNVPPGVGRREWPRPRAGVQFTAVRTGTQVSPGTAAQP